MSCTHSIVFQFLGSLICICLFEACSHTTQSPETSKEDYFIEYVANEGVLVQLGKSSILIDAVHSPYRPQYQATPDSVFQDMLNGESPFEEVALCLVSHVHRDHQSSEKILQLLQRRPEIRLIAPKQAIDSIAAFGKAGIPKNAYISLTNTSPKQVWDQASIQVTSIPIPHTYPQLNSWVQHYAYLIKTAEDKHLLHLGDAYAVNKHLETLRSSLPDTIDIAMVPFWFLYDRAWKWLKEDLNVKQILAIHVPIPDAAKLEKEMELLDARITVFRHLGEQKYIEK